MSDERSISLTNAGERHGVIVEQAFDGAPDAEGVLVSFRLELPQFKKAVYFAPEIEKSWPNAANRVVPYPAPDWQGAPKYGLFLLLELADGGYLALLPAASARTVSWLEPAGDHLALRLGSLGTGPLQGDFAAAAWARGADPYAVCLEAWNAALNHPLIAHSAKLREQKAYPDIFRYLGWCSWEEYKGRIDEAILLDAVAQIEASGLPIRYCLIDDGHLDHSERQLRSFRPNTKFSQGWSALLDRRKDDRVRWFGLWLNFNGYWQGIAPQNELGELNAHLEPTLAGPLQPRRDPLSSIAFYDAMIGEARRAGFDFVKVDNQAANLGWYRGMPAAAECAANNQKALEKSCAFHMDGLINCMAHGTICLFNARLSAVSRCSRDYKLGDPEVAKRHIEQSYASMAWMGPVFWGDHDMFHSNDPCCGALMARSKALSGAPVYLSDAPDRFDYEHVRPLCYANGELLRPLAPASPLPESLFFDPCAEGRAYRVIAPLASASAAFCAYNLTEPNQMVKASVSIRDYERAGQLMQPSRRWEPPAEGLLVYDWASAEAHVLEKNAEYGFSLEGFSDRLLLLCPIRNGWAVVGRSDKYLSPAAVEILDCAEDELIVRMEESGPLTLWSESGFLCCETADFAGAGAGLWTARMKVGERGTTLRVRRKG